MEAQIIPKDQVFYPFFFQQIRLEEACWIDGIPHFTREAIGEWLGYRDPQRAVAKIIKRNPYINNFSTVVKLTTVQSTGKGEKYEREMEIRVYNPIGFQLIVFESHQPKAKAYKINVANLTLAYVQGRLTPPQGPLTFQVMDITCLPEHSRERGDAIRELAQDLNKSPWTIRRYIKRTENNEPLVKKTPTGYAWKRSREAKAKAERLHKRLPGMKYKDISRLLNINIRTIYKWLGSPKED